MRENNCGKTYISYKNTTNGNILLFPYRCKNRKECITCAREYSNLKFTEYKNILTKMFLHHGKGDFYYGELTIPKNISKRLSKNKDNYRRFKQCASKVINSLFGITPALIVFQNWGKEDPTVPNWHIHYIVIPWDKDGQIVDYDPSRKEMLYSWRYELFSDKLIKKTEKDNVKVVNLEKISRNSYSVEDDVMNRVHYMCKEPIEIVESTTMNETDFKKFIDVVSSMKKHFHRFSWTNWLSNSQKTKALKNLGIVLKEKYNISKEYRQYSKDGRIEINEKGEQIYIPKTIITEDELKITARDTDRVVIDGNNCRIVKDRVRPDYTQSLTGGIL